MRFKSILMACLLSACMPEVSDDCFGDCPLCLDGICIPTPDVSADSSMPSADASQQNPPDSDDAQTETDALSDGDVKPDGDATQDAEIPNDDVFIQEFCDGIDNDNDGLTDEDFRELNQSCQLDFTQGLISCSLPGLFLCAENHYYASCQQTQIQQEICDQYDNDCNGLTDDMPAQHSVDGQTSICFHGKMTPIDELISSDLFTCRKTNEQTFLLPTSENIADFALHENWFAWLTQEQICMLNTTAPDRSPDCAQLNDSPAPNPHLKLLAQGEALVALWQTENELKMGAFSISTRAFQPAFELASIRRFTLLPQNGLLLYAPQNSSTLYLKSLTQPETSAIPIPYAQIPQEALFDALIQDQYFFLVFNQLDSFKLLVYQLNDADNLLTKITETEVAFDQNLALDQIQLALKANTYHLLAVGSEQGELFAAHFAFNVIRQQASLSGKAIKKPLNNADPLILSQTSHAWVLWNPFAPIYLSTYNEPLPIPLSPLWGNGQNNLFAFDFHELQQLKFAQLDNQTLSITQVYCP